MSRIDAGLLVERRAALDPDRLADRDLDVVDELAVPDRLEDAVREPQREHVLDRLLAEVVVDPEDLVLGEVLLQDLVQPVRRRAVVAERLLDDQPDPALRAPPLAELVDDRLEGRRRHGEVVEAVPAAAALLVEVVQRLDDAVLPFVVGEVGRDVAHPVGELAPDLRVELVARVLPHRLLHLRGPLLRRLLGAGDADDAEALGQQPPERERVERREELPPGSGRRWRRR